jgi:zinc protease
MTLKTAEQPAPAGEPAMSLLPIPGSPLITFRIQFGVGAIDDPEKRFGLNTLTALTIGEGGTGDLTYRQVIDRLFPMAASIQAHPDREVTTYVAQVHRDHLEEFYGLLSGILLRPRFDPNDFRRHRDLLIAAIETSLRGQDDEELGKEALSAFLFAGHPYGHPVLGTVEGLRAITLDDVKGHYRRHYTRGALLAGVAGGYPESLLPSIARDFRGLPAGETARPALPRPAAIRGMELFLVEKAEETVAISLGFPLPVTRADREFYPLMVANSYLGEHRTFNGRLMNVMRADRGLNYGDYSYIETFLQEGGSSVPLTNIPRRQQTFSIWIRPVARANAAFALKQAVRELRRLIDRGLTAEEFEATRRYLLNASRLWAGSQSRRLGHQMDARFYGLASFLERVQEELPRLRIDQVNAAVKAHLTAADLKVAMVGPEMRRLAEELQGAAPTPIRYQTPTTDSGLLAEDEQIAAYRLPINAAGIRFADAQSLFQT